MSAWEIAGQVRLTEKGRRAFDELKEGFDPGEILASLEERGLTAITFADEDYPERLTEIPDPPPVLFVNGEVPEGPAGALFGSREGSGSGGGGGPAGGG